MVYMPDNLPAEGSGTQSTVVEVRNRSGGGKVRAVVVVGTGQTRLYLEGTSLRRAASL